MSKNRNRKPENHALCDKREKEKQVVDLMIRLYCRKKHRGMQGENKLCAQCQELREYARQRSDHCPFMETKTFCSNCRVHCYKPEMREKMREVMRCTGPGMLFVHRVVAIRHVMETNREKRRLEELG